MAEEEQVHVLVVSFPAQGHINPLLRLAKRIASKGVTVTFSSTADIGHRMYSSKKTTAAAQTAGGKGYLRFEFFSDEWEDNDPRRTNDLDAYMTQLRTVGPSRVADLIRNQALPVTCVINNPFVPWVLDVAEELSIPSAVLWVQSCAVFSIYYHYVHSLAEFPTVENPNVAVTLPGLPTLKYDELPTFLLPTNPYKSLTEVILLQFHNISKATWVFANSFEELECDTINAISKLTPVIPVGPLVDVGELESEVSGDLFKAADCMEWLDSQTTNSVVYVSVGSVVVLSNEEMEEMAYGLVNSGRPFLWVVRESCMNLLPQRFFEESKGKGLLVTWSPQEKVLEHDAVGCFVTHCGWNSTLEALTSGVPVVAYPQWGDQVPDAKFLVDVYGVGVRVKAPIKREELEKCIEEVMEGEKAEEMRERAVELKVAAEKAVKDEGSSDKNILAFVNEIRR